MLFVLMLLVLVWGAAMFVYRKELVFFYKLFRDVARENRLRGRHSLYGIFKDDDPSHD
ncbi:MAG: hypothetical protein ACTJG2_03240 [Candidatus Saccharimonadales bacterium]